MEDVLYAFLNERKTTIRKDKTGGKMKFVKLIVDISIS